MIHELANVRSESHSLVVHGDFVYMAHQSYTLQWCLITNLRVTFEGSGMLFMFALFFVLRFLLSLGAIIYVVDIAPDGRVVVAGGFKVMIAHDAATGEVLWRREMPGKIQSLRIHGNVVVAPVYGSMIAVLDLTSGDQIHTLPSAGNDVNGICVFDGLAEDLFCAVTIFFPWFLSFYSTAHESCHQDR